MIFCLLGLILAADTAAYPNARLLVAPESLVRHIPETARLLDVRSAKEYAEGHLPRAVHVDANAWDKAFGNGDDPVAWADRIGRAGLQLNQPVIVYSNDDVRAAARIWWILRYWGVRDVRLLDGGYAAWTAAGGQGEREPVQPEPVALRLEPVRNRLTRKEDLLTGLKDQPPQVIDARSAAEHCGEKTTAKRNGAIPGAIHLEWTELLQSENQRFKPLAELKQLINERKIDLNQPAVTYCQSGGRASVVAFALELMGGRQVRNYYASWSEWGNAADTPIVKPTPAK